VLPLPPYYKDIVESALPLPDLPRRKIRLVAGDYVYVDYALPEIAPSESDADYDLYMKYVSVISKRQEVQLAREKARVDYLLSTCVSIVSGPIDFDDFEAWIPMVEAAFESYSVPEHKGKRYLVFLKTFVIKSVEWMELILETCLNKEVSVQGISNALHTFRYKMA
jgi:hypothetical protein